MSDTEDVPPPRLTLRDQIQCVKREVFLRETVYPKRVSQKRMSKDRADRELACMRQVLRTLEAMISNGK